MISIVVPAHNESSVIGRSLKAITSGASCGELDLIVVCNGCTDNTAEIARSFGSPVRVIETDIASKRQALNLGDKAAHAFPRIFVDADVLITLGAIRALANRLRRGDVLAVAPLPCIDLSGCSRTVLMYFDVKARLPQSLEGIGGSGVYALSEAGRSRFGEFPELTADDGFVRIQFSPEERETLGSVSSTIFAPRTIKHLIAVRTRVYYGNFELVSLFPKLWKNNGNNNNIALILLSRYPTLWPSLLIYFYVNFLARRKAKTRFRRKAFVWERDNTSRGVDTIASVRSAISSQ